MPWVDNNIIIVLNSVVSSWPTPIWPNAFLGDSRRKSACPVFNTNEIHMQTRRYTIMSFKQCPLELNFVTIVLTLNYVPYTCIVWWGGKCGIA